MTLYVCDLDGTLLRSDATLSAYAAGTLDALIGEGARITVASARSVPAIRRLLDGVALRLPVIELDGGFLSDLATGRHLDQCLLSPAAAVRAVDLLAEAGRPAVVTTFDGATDHVSYTPDLNPGTRWFVAEKRAYDDPRLRPVEDLTGVVRTELTAVVTAFAPLDVAGGIVERLAAELAADVHASAAPHVYVPGWAEIRVSHAGANKGNAVRALVRVTGLAGAEVVVCGDHLNDLPMFAVADRSVAPANALPEVREQATVVVADNDADGVVRFLAAEHAAAVARAAAVRPGAAVAGPTDGSRVG
jgi:hydroxymethylpyrimidine pyrophosphatase-like HAD family hydrolase